jgi:hypothetical protein
LSKVAKRPTDDPVWKFLEQRHQWQKRYFNVKGAVASAAYTDGTQEANMLKVDVKHDQYGKTVSTPTRPLFLLNGSIVIIPDTTGTPRHFKITADPDITTDTSEAELDLTPQFSATCAFADDAIGIVSGSSFGEGTTEPKGWKDELYNREGYTQIFKTAIDLFSGTTMATRYRGRPDEFRRVWMEKLMEHKIDIETAMLFGRGRSDESGSPPERRSWGLATYAHDYGKVYNMSYSTSTWDTFLEHSSDFMHVESGNDGKKLVLAPLRVMNWLNRITDGFLKNTVGTDAYRMNIAQVPGSWGHNLTRVTTPYMEWNFVYEPLLRGPYENWCIAADLRNLAIRPLAANGRSRDTFIETNIQTPGTDGRKDQIITECGLEVSLPETHAVIKFTE